MNWVESHIDLLCEEIARGRATALALVVCAMLGLALGMLVVLAFSI